MSTNYICFGFRNYIYEKNIYQIHTGGPGADPEFLERGFLIYKIKVWDLALLIYLIFLTETILFHFHTIFKKKGDVKGGGGGGGGVSEPPLNLPLRSNQDSS